MAVRSMVVLAGRYRLEAPLGRGGMGEVWRAVDLRLRRSVAVKIFPLTAAAEPADVGRFRHEAEAAAALNHPGITTVFDVDEHRDGEEHWLFLVMELLVGRDLRHLIAGHSEGLPIERVRDLAVQIAEALGAAHRGGVVHRDIKPANLFLLDEGRVKICDFGIARIADATKITTTGSVAGTPMYMAPEQIQSGTVDHRTDLYAFGCVLYELLTGKPWIPADSNIAAILNQHLNQPPAPPKSVRADIPDEFDALVLDLLVKRPDDRPPDAVAVTERLRGFPAEPGRTLQGEPPSGEPSDLLGESEPDPSDGRAIVRDARFLLNGDSTVATLGGDIGPAESVAFSPDGETLATGSWDGVARLWDLRTGRIIGTFTHHASTFTGGAADVYSVAFSPDGRTLATGSHDRTARLWDVETSRTICTFAGHTDWVWSVAFSPDGKTLATGSQDGTVRLWPLGTVRLWAVRIGRLLGMSTGRTIGTSTGRGGPVESVAFSPDGKMLAADSHYAALLLDMETGRVIGTSPPHNWAVSSVAFSPDGKTLATGSRDGTAQLWGVRTGRIVGKFEGNTSFPGHAPYVESVAFSPDGKTLAIGGEDGIPRLWDVRTRRTVRTFAGHTGAIVSVAFSPDGKILATGGVDETVRLWKI